MFNKFLNFVYGVICFCSIMLVSIIMAGDLGNKKYEHQTLIAILIFVVSFLVFKKISPGAGLAVCLIAHLIARGMHSSADEISELFTDLTPLISFGIGFGILYLLFFKSGSRQSGSSESSESRSEERRYYDTENESRREQQKKWGSPVGSGSCPYLLRIDMGYYEGWDCYRCAKTGGTFDDNYCRNLCYYEWKYKNCRAKD